MPHIERAVILEALSVLTGADVRPLSESEGWHTTFDQLTTDNFLFNVYGTSCALSQLPVTADYTSELSLPSLWSNLSLSSLSQTSASRRELFVDLDDFLDSRFDYNFKCRLDFSKCSRGGEPYSRPWGWYRFALKVLDKYPDGNTWLGSGGWRNNSSPGEWPVSFHGTSIDGAIGIARSYYRAGPGQTYGRGIYSTPDIKVASTYAMIKKFTSIKTGKTYKVIMQNRINPEKRIITDKKNYWLIPVPERTSAAHERRIVEESIRPYGILIKKV